MTSHINTRPEESPESHARAHEVAEWERQVDDPNQYAVGGR